MSHSKGPKTNYSVKKGGTHVRVPVTPRVQNPSALKKKGRSRALAKDSGIR